MSFWSTLGDWLLLRFIWRQFSSHRNSIASSVNHINNSVIMDYDEYSINIDTDTQCDNDILSDDMDNDDYTSYNYNQNSYDDYSSHYTDYHNDFNDYDDFIDDDW